MDTSKLPFELIDVWNIIKARSLGNSVDCDVGPDGTTLRICDDLAIHLEFEAVKLDRASHGTGILLILPFGPAVAAAHQNYTAFKDGVLHLCTKYALIPQCRGRERQNHEVYVRFGVATLFEWRKSLHELTKDIEKSIAKLRNFYVRAEMEITNLYDATKIEAISDQDFVAIKRERSCLGL